MGKSLYDLGSCISSDHNTALQESEEQKNVLLKSLPAFHLPSPLLPMLACSVRQDTIQAALSSANSRSTGYQSFRPFYITTSQPLNFLTTHAHAPALPAIPLAPDPILLRRIGAFFRLSTCGCCCVESPPIVPSSSSAPSSRSSSASSA